ncbi:hypothetical protein Salat_2914200 [Sesamum alatum]|uniref:Retrovirus-related Pol polyprotein from transposon TNT 1-94-like beta-barrel domain-containing protein n=1 Tax=Sesamum alatum TaxID=300844 RepID=A0AAE2C899_9LAMI|nr:hypothetical protein Salat_2914200 [Sesamum alatum]
MADNLKLPIAHVGNTMVSPQYNETKVPLKDVFHVLGMMKNLLSVAQLTSSGHVLLFGPQDVKVYCNMEILGEPVIMGQRMESVYVMSAETAYIDKGMTIKENDDDAATRQPGNATLLEMSCSMKLLLGGPLERKYYQIPVSSERR